MYEKAVALLGTAETYRAHIVWWWLASVLAVVAILIRWRWPLLAFTLAAAAALAHAFDLKLWLFGLSLMPIDLAALITLHTLASVTRRRRTGLIALALAVGAEFLTVVVALNTTVARGQRLTVLAFPNTGTASNALMMSGLPALLLATAWAVGDNVRTHR